MSKPTKLENIEIDTLVQLCQDRIDEIADGDDVDSDLPHYIYEAAMEAVFGNNVWSWINERSK